MTLDVREELDRYGQDGAFFEHHLTELQTRYPRQWVAIWNQAIVGASPDLQTLLDQLRRDNVPIDRAFIEQTTPDETVLILPV